MNRVQVLGAVLIVVCGLIIVGSALAAGGFAIPRDVCGSAGQRVTGGSYILDGTLGEPIAGNWSARMRSCAKSETS